MCISSTFFTVVREFTPLPSYHIFVILIISMSNMNCYEQMRADGEIRAQYAEMARVRAYRLGGGNTREHVKSFGSAVKQKIRTSKWAM